MGILFAIIGVLLFVSNKAIRYYLSRRRFNRRAITGLEGFDSYEHALVTRAYERILRLISRIIYWIGLLLILFGWWYSGVEAEKKQQEQIENSKPKK